MLLLCQYIQSYHDALLTFLQLGKLFFLSKWILIFIQVKIAIECDSDGSTELQTHVERMESYRDKLYKSAKRSIVKSKKKNRSKSMTRDIA